MSFYTQFAFVTVQFTKLLIILQGYISDEKSSAAKLLSSITDIGTSLFATLEADFSVPIADQRSRIQEQHKVLAERLSSTVKLMVSSETLNIENGQARKSQVPAWSKLTRYHSLVIILFSALLLRIFCML